MQQHEPTLAEGDGAQWIWHIAERHFPRATQIVDWYHASEYLWNASSAIWGQAGEERAAWAQAQLDVLWEGQVGGVVVELEQWRERGGCGGAETMVSTSTGWTMPATARAGCRSAVAVRKARVNSW